MQEGGVVIRLGGGVADTFKFGAPVQKQEGGG